MLSSADDSCCVTCLGCVLAVFGLCSCGKTATVLIGGTDIAPSLAYVPTASFQQQEEPGNGGEWLPALHWDLEWGFAYSQGVQGLKQAPCLSPGQERKPGGEGQP